jgi:hypothetical protein
MPTPLADAVGWAGAACLLLAYAGLSSGRLVVGLRYHLINLAGAFGLVVNGTTHHAWPSTAFNLIWSGIGLTALHCANDGKVRISTPHSGTATDQRAASGNACDRDCRQTTPPGR